jgi:hypothetical protein
MEMESESSERQTKRNMVKCRKPKHVVAHKVRGERCSQRYLEVWYESIRRHIA